MPARPPEWEVRLGDCLALMRAMPEASVDAVVTDPPAGIGFMAKSWDSDKGGRVSWVAWLESVLAECLRLLKPGGHAVVWSLPRTSHWTGTAIEQAGFEVRDVVTHLFGSGFPKSHNLPGGLGTALKPAAEFWWLARKPLIGTVAANVERHGTGALNVDGCRIGTTVETWPSSRRNGAGDGRTCQRGSGEAETVGCGDSPPGRWPANVALDEAAAAMLDEQSGELHPPGSNGQANAPVASSWSLGNVEQHPSYGDFGGASRFFFCAKASRAEREAGLDRAARISYPDSLWVSAVLDPPLLAATGASHPRATFGSTIRCSVGTAWSMCWCGSPSTDPSHPAIRSIIETAARPTTDRRTWNSSPRPHTNGCMAVAFGETGRGGSHAASAASRSPWAERIGTSPLKDGPSTDGADLATSVESWLTREPERGGGHRVGVRNVHPT